MKWHRRKNYVTLKCWLWVLSNFSRLHCYCILRFNLVSKYFINFTHLWAKIKWTCISLVKQDVLIVVIAHFETIFLSVTNIIEIVIEMYKEEYSFENMLFNVYLLWLLTLIPFYVVSAFFRPVLWVTLYLPIRH